MGTLFLPTNSALDAMSEKVGGDFKSIAASNPEQSAEVFAYSGAECRQLLGRACWQERWCWCHLTEWNAARAPGFIGSRARRDALP
jgi:hypothetical protein